MHRSICLLLILLTAEFNVFAQDNLVAKQFNSLMGEPNTVVSALLNFPWKKESPESLPGFKSVAPPGTMRIVSDGTEFVGIGILPDVKAAKSKRDVASGRDAVLETAIDLAQRGQTTNQVGAPPR